MIYEFHRKLIEKLLESDEVIASLSGETGSIGIILSDPSLRLRLVIDGSKTRLGTVNSSDGSVDDPSILMTCETALKFWLGDLDIMSAVLNGSIRVEGMNMDPLFKLKSIISQAREISQAVAEELGWN